jgi:hypothetical protein
MPDDLTERATLGAQQFVRRGAGVVTPPPLAGVPVTLVDGTPLVSLREGDAAYLVLDHRPWPPTAEPAYVEWWMPLRPAEGDLAGLFVLTQATARRTSASSRRAARPSPSPSPPRSPRVRADGADPDRRSLASPRPLRDERPRCPGTPATHAARDRGRVHAGGVALRAGARGSSLPHCARPEHGARGAAAGGAPGGQARAAKGAPRRRCSHVALAPRGSAAGAEVSVRPRPCRGNSCHPMGG